VHGCTSPEDSTKRQEGAKREYHAPEAEASGLPATLARQGIDFYARGDEPFWALDMDLDSVTHFTALGDLSLSVPAVEGVRAQDADVLRFHAETEAGTLTVTITGEQCVDTMSGEEFTHRVRVEAKRSTDAESQTFEGCGRYVPDPRLGGAWILETLDGEAISGEGLMKGPPMLEFRVDEGRVGGHGGCNAIMGIYLNQWKTLRFGQLASTLMACPDMSVEQAFVAALSGKPFRYGFQGKDLILSGPEGSTLRFRPAP
jgi:heat shock protein HslJ/uncharacterized membrane protein